MAAEYERARPGYPDAAIAWLAERLGLGPGRDVLDLGAGTGKLTRQLVALGARVVAVEPLGEMRAELERAVPGVAALPGTAEQIPLGDGLVDAVTCAQAFHWFDAEAALAEMARVLRPGGGVGLLWNTRDGDDRLQAEISEIVGTRERVGEGEGALIESVACSGMFGAVERKHFAHAQRLSPAHLVDRVASMSAVAVLPADARVDVLERVARLAAREGEPIRFAYVTEAFAFRRS